MDPATTSPQDLIRTITVLTEPPTDPAHQSRCAAFLFTFASHPAAWAAFPAVIASPAPPPVRFFAANGLYSKVRCEWHALPPPARDAVLGQLWAALEGAAAGGAGGSDVPVLRRLCLALAAATVQTLGALAPLFSRVAALATRALSAPPLPHGALLLLVCAEALCAAAEMAEELQLPPRIRGALQSDAAAAAPSVHALLLALVAGGAGSPVGVDTAAAACAAAGGAPDAPLPALALAAALRCARAWCAPGCAGAVFPSACLAGDAPLLRAAVEALAALPGAACGGCAAEAAGFFTAVFEDSGGGAAAAAAAARLWLQGAAR